MNETPKPMSLFDDDSSPPAEESTAAPETDLELPTAADTPDLISGEATEPVSASGPSSGLSSHWIEPSPIPVTAQSPAEPSSAGPKGAALLVEAETPAPRAFAAADQGPALPAEAQAIPSAPTSPDPWLATPAAAAVDAWLASDLEGGASQLTHPVAVPSPPDAAPIPDPWLSSDAAAAVDAWLASSPSGIPTDDGPLVVGPSGRLERVRPERTPLIPKWLPWTVLGVLVVGFLIAGIAAYSSVRARVIVPTVTGLQSTVARERAGSVGLNLTVSDRRFSTLPVDTVLVQTPEAGTQSRRGSAVTVIVSAGTEEFTMPDVVGQGLALVRSTLEEKGLRVEVTPQPSDQPIDTVLATNPAAGSPMHTGDLVTITTAASSTGTTTPTLVPFTMNGVKVTVDPAPPVAGQSDTTFEIARRLKSLLEASGAAVSMTRLITDTNAASTGSALARQTKAQESSPTVAVGLDVTALSAQPGIAVNYPGSAGATASAAPSQLLASQITSALVGAGLTAHQNASGTDVVLAVTGAPYNRVTVGSTSSREDLANFRDPAWADKVARSIYQGIAAIYGTRNPAGL